MGGGGGKWWQSFFYLYIFAEWVEVLVRFQGTGLDYDPPPPFPPAGVVTSVTSSAEPIGVPNLHVAEFDIDATDIYVSANVLALTTSL